jgi:hypothetical protein
MGKKKKLDKWQQGYVDALREQLGVIHNFLADLDELWDNTASKNAVVAAASLSNAISDLTEEGK